MVGDGSDVGGVDGEDGGVVGEGGENAGDIGLTGRGIVYF